MCVCEREREGRGGYDSLWEEKLVATLLLGSPQKQDSDHLAVE